MIKHWAKFFPLIFFSFIAHKKFLSKCLLLLPFYISKKWRYKIKKPVEGHAKSKLWKHNERVLEKLQNYPGSAMKR